METENNIIIGELSSRIEDYNSFLDMVDIIFVIIDEHNKIRMVNNKACSVLEYEKEEVLGKSPREFLSPSVKDMIDDHVVRLFNGDIKSDEYLEFPFLTKNGQERIIKCKYAYLRDKNGKVIYVLVSGEDITEKKREEYVQLTISRIPSASNSEADKIGRASCRERV